MIERKPGGEVLREARIATGLSQQAAAFRATPPLSQGHLNNIELGVQKNIRPKTLKRLSQAYGLEPVEILDAFGIEAKEDFLRAASETEGHTEDRHIPSFAEALHKLMEWGGVQPATETAPQNEPVL